MSLPDLRGKVVVLNFIYTNCPDVCLLHTERIADVQALVNQIPTKEFVQFVTVTIDPARDTYEVIQRHGSAYGLDPTNRTFLTSGPDRPELREFQEPIYDTVLRGEFRSFTAQKLEIVRNGAPEDTWFGLTTDESRYLYLSDGSDFKNLALYEMVRWR